MKQILQQLFRVT